MSSIIRIKVPQKLTLLALECVVDTSDKAKEWLRENHYYGFSSCCEGRGRRILVDNSLEEREFSATFIHEVCEFIRGTVLGGEMSHLKINIIGNCIHQILEQLGIRFVK